jgi:hypothetical protein
VRVIAEVALPPTGTVTEAGTKDEVKPVVGRVNRLTDPEKPVRAWTVTVEVSEAPQL